MMDGGQPTSSISDPGLAALVMLLRFQGVGIAPEQIGHQFGGYRSLGQLQRRQSEAG